MRATIEMDSQWGLPQVRSGMNEGILEEVTTVHFEESVCDFTKALWIYPAG